MTKAEQETLRMIDELPEEQRKYVERMSDEDTRAFLIWRAQERAQILVGRLGGKAPAEELLARIDHRISHELRRNTEGSSAQFPSLRIERLSDRTPEAPRESLGLSEVTKGGKLPDTLLRPIEPFHSIRDGNPYL